METEPKEITVKSGEIKYRTASLTNKITVCYKGNNYQPKMFYISPAITRTVTAHRSNLICKAEQPHSLPKTASVTMEAKYQTTRGTDFHFSDLCVYVYIHKSDYSDNR